MPSIDEQFAGAEEAEIQGGGKKLTDGDYNVTFLRMGKKSSQRRRGEERVIVEMRIDQIHRCAKPNEYAPGMKVSFTADLANPKTVQNIKELLFAGCGRVGVSVPKGDPDHKLVVLIAKAACDPTCSAVAELAAPPYNVPDVQALISSMSARVACETIDTEKGFKYVVHRWSPVEAA